MLNPRRVWRLEAIKGEQTLAEIGAKHCAHLTIVAAWKKAAIDGMAAFLVRSGAAGKPDNAEMARLHAKMAS